MSLPPGHSGYSFLTKEVPVKVLKSLGGIFAFIPLAVAGLCLLACVAARRLPHARYHHMSYS